MMTVYPRVCGGTDYLRMQSALQDGLSPRVRGNRLVPCYAPLLARSIPACAGEPVPPNVSIYMPKVYPACAGEPESQRWGRIRPGVYPRVCGGTT